LKNKNVSGEPAPMTTRKAPLWDLPVRLFHWSLPVLLLTAWLSAEFDALDIHEWCGYTVLVLVSFRIVWGFIGSRHARFSDFLRSPAAAIRYLRGREPERAGHNPAGGWSVLAMLALLLAQALTGLFNSDDVGFSGPLVHALDDDLVDTLAAWHEVNFNLLLALVALHVGTVLFYLLRRKRNLINPMLNGGESPTADPVTPAWLALLVIIVLGGLLYWLLSLAPEPPPPFL
jgi:cytochrome b